MADFTNVAMLTARSNYSEIDFQRDTGFPQTENAFQFLIARDDSKDLFVIKKAATATQRTEVHIYSALSSYQTAILEVPTSLPESDDSWTFALAVNRDLYGFQRSSNSSEQTLLVALSHQSNYQSHVHHQYIMPHDFNQGHDYEYLVDSNNDVWVIKKKPRGLPKTEIHILTENSGYQTFGGHLATGLPPTDLTWSFLGVDPNKNVWVVNRKESGSVLYRLTAESNYTEKDSVTLDFPKLDHRYSFALAPNSTVKPDTFDLFVIKTSRTSSPMVTLQVVSKPFHYQGPRPPVCKTAHPVTGDLHAFSWVTPIPQFTDNNDEKGLESYLAVVKKHHTNFTEVSFFRKSYRFRGPSEPLVTVWPTTDDSCEFLFTHSGLEMIVIKKSNCHSQKVEVHILSAESKYQGYNLEVPTPLDEVDHTWKFLLADNKDLICIHKSGTNSTRTECSRILFTDGNKQHYSTWSPKTLGGDIRTALPETDDSWEFLLAPNDDLYAIHKYGTTSNFTDIKVLSAASDWKEITKEFQTALPQTDYNYSFCLTSDLNLVAVQKSRFPFSADMASI